MNFKNTKSSKAKKELKVKNGKKSSKICLVKKFRLKKKSLTKKTDYSTTEFTLKNERENLCKMTHKNVPKLIISKMAHFHENSRWSQNLFLHLKKLLSHSLAIRFKTIYFQKGSKREGYLQGS